MARSRLLVASAWVALAWIAAVSAASQPSLAEWVPKATTPEPAKTETPSEKKVETGAIPSPEAPVAADPLTAALRQKLAPPASNASEEDQREASALTAFYESRNAAPLWVTPTGLNDKAKSAIAEIQNAGAYGLDAKAFTLPSAPEVQADAELKLSTAALLYARHARGGRIMKPAEQLNSNLDRKPQLIDPKIILEGLAANDDAGAYLRSTHPKHAQFEKLRQAYLKEIGSKTGEAPVKLNATAKRLRANMEMWRWMYDDMGDVHVFNNIPEFMQYVYKNGEIIRSEKIVAGMIDKQSSIFSRPLKYVVLRPKWRVPESIMVHEVWPSLRRGGGLMRQYGLQLETKEGKSLDWRKIDWSKDDIRNYIVTQPPGGISALGVVKFSFPSQHTIFMHDTPDKWMFRHSQRTLSHGCLRVQKPVELAEIMLREGNGWTREKMLEQMKSGPLNNEVVIEKRIPIHLTYFTAWVDAAGKTKFFGDVYGHEKRITQALDGDWAKIAKGRDHLAAPQPNFNPKAPVPQVAQHQRKRKLETTGGIISDVLGLSF
jgi:L,D-transpeptidase YcbB